MPNPFPGMNPYLENPSQWREVHTSLIYCFRTALGAALPAPFMAQMEERVYMENVGKQKDYIADAVVVEKMPLSSFDVRDVNGTHSQNMNLPVFDAPQTLTFDPFTEHERFIEVRSRRDKEEVVAVIEFLSPKNKTPGVGRNEYKRKQADVLSSTAHLLKIDLLRAGQGSFAPPEAVLRQQLGAFDYLISLHRAETGNEFDFWHVTLRDRLPRLRLPLTENESVVVDLQAVLQRVYDEGQFDLLIDYTKPPIPPLSADNVEWANGLVAKMNATNQAEPAGTLETKDL